MKIVALAGGVGGAKLVDGLSQILPPDNLKIIVNTGDDFEHLGLHISPDLDTVCYTLAGLANPETGWGRLNETYNMLDSLSTLGGETWFRLGDRDLATHIERSHRLRQGESLSRITGEFCTAWGVGYQVLPMSDQPVHTMVDTVDDGELSFQEYFVHKNSIPRVKGFRFSGSDAALPSPGLINAIIDANAVVICPSNPWVSIDSIFSIPGIRDAVTGKLVVAVSPIVGGQTLKGPAAKMFSELGIYPSSLAVAEHYYGLLNGYIIDTVDAIYFKNLQRINIFPRITNTIMKSEDDRRLLAKVVLDLIQQL